MGSGGQLPGAGARAAARPKRPRRASRSSSAWPRKAIAARAQAMTAARASPSRGPARVQAGPVTARGEAAERGRGVLAQVAGGRAGAAASPARSPAGRPAPRRSRALPVPRRAAAAAARAITPVPSARRGAIQDGSRTAIFAPQDRHRPRGGEVTARSPRCSRTARSRPRPHGPRRPRPHDGHLSEPATRFRPRGLRVGAQQHGTVLSWSRPDGSALGPHSPPGAARVARSQPGRRPATRRPVPASRATVSAGAVAGPWPGGQRPGMLRVSSHARHRHVEGDSHRQRRQGPISRSKRTAANTRHGTVRC